MFCNKPVAVLRENRPIPEKLRQGNCGLWDVNTAVHFKKINFTFFYFLVGLVCVQLNITMWNSVLLLTWWWSRTAGEIFVLCVCAQYHVSETHNVPWCVRDNKSWFILRAMKFKFVRHFHCGWNTFPPGVMLKSTFFSFSFVWLDVIVMKIVFCFVCEFYFFVECWQRRWIILFTFHLSSAANCVVVECQSDRSRRRGVHTSLDEGVTTTFKNWFNMTVITQSRKSRLPVAICELNWIEFKVYGFCFHMELTHFLFLGLLLPLVLTGCGGSELTCIPHDVLVHIGGETDVVLSLRYCLWWFCVFPVLSNYFLLF